MAMQTIIAVEAAIALLIWILSPFKVLPQPGEVLSALQRLWMTQGLGQQLATSFGLNLQALAWVSIEALLKRFGIEEHAAKYPSQLSGGQRQRVAIAQQFMCSEHFLLMDEPFSGLDLIAQERVRAGTRDGFHSRDGGVR